MTYRIISGGTDSDAYTMEQLHQMANLGQLTADSELKDENGVVLPAESVVPIFRQSQGTQSPTNPPPFQSSQFQSPPSSAAFSGSTAFQGSVPPSNSQSGGYFGMANPTLGVSDSDYIIALVCSILGFFTPIVLSIIGLYFGKKAQRQGHPNAKLPITLSWISLAITGGIFAFWLLLVLGVFVLAAVASHGSSPAFL